MFSRLSTLTLVLATLLPLTTTSPLHKRFTEDEPWHLTTLSLYTSSGAANLNSTFTFLFADNNPGLQLSTSCNVSLPAIDTLTYYPCENATVGFRLGEGRLELKRTYVDPSVGPYPLWFVTAFGHANTTLRIVEDNEVGSRAVQESLDVVVTELIA